MMKWCKQGKIDLILTKSVSRFARNTVDCLNYVRMLKAQGIAVYFEKENINSMDESTELMLTMMGAFCPGGERVHLRQYSGRQAIRHAAW